MTLPGPDDYTVPDFGDDIISGTDVITRVQFLEKALAGLGETEDDTREDIVAEIDAWARLRNKHGQGLGKEGGIAVVTFIQDFRKHAREYAAGLLGSEVIDEWPCTAIDWDDAEGQLRENYCAITVTDQWGDDHVFYVRN